MAPVFEPSRAFHCLDQALVMPKKVFVMSLEALWLYLMRATPWVYIYQMGEANNRSQWIPGNPTDPNGEPIMANLSDLDPFWVGARLLCIETLVECLC